MTVTIANKGHGERGLFTADGTLRFVKPGQTMTGDFHEDDLADAREHPDLDVKDHVDQFDGMTEEQLRAHLAERDGKAPHPNAKRETLLAKARGE